MGFFLVLSLCLTTCLLANDPMQSVDPALEGVEIRLKDPIFRNGSLFTDSGGVIEAEGIRIQARRIEYLNKEEDGQKIVSIVAEGDLLLEYEGRFFVGSRLEYDFVRHTGTLWDGQVGVGIWFIGGDKIELAADGSYTVKGAYVTACESQDAAWEIRSRSLKISEGHLLRASGVQFNFFRIPVLWIPSFKSNLSFFSDPPVKYKLVWDRGIGPRITMRYRVFSWEELSLFFRLDYRLTEGPGAAAESEYFSKSGRTTFVTQSYGAYSKVVYDEHGLKRYRLKGLFTHESADKKTTTLLSYDKFRDLKMLSDFASSDFVIDTQQRTRLLVNHQEKIAFGTLSVEPRVNPFESINQQLPLGIAGVRPFSIASTGILSENYVSAGYLDYVYATDLVSTYPALRQTHAARIETRNRLYRPFSGGPVHITPTVGLVGLFYNNSPEHTSIGQGVFTYGGRASLSPFYRTFKTYRHGIEPYADYMGLSRPKFQPDRQYIFSMADGFYKINSLKLGVRNTLIRRSAEPSYLFSPDLFLDVYTYAYFNDDTFQKTCPKWYVTGTWSRPSYLFQAHTCWNFEENVLDFSNLLTEITVNAYTALAFEFRHRSRFDWRKADHENFILDMARSIPELLDSPLSDGRNTFLTRLQLKLTPKWTCRFSSHLGWGRNDDPSYNSFKLEAFTLLASHWRLKFSYMHTTNDDRFGMGLQLVK